MRKTLADYVKEVLNEDDEEGKMAGAEKEEKGEKKEKDEGEKEKKECDTVVTIECCGTAVAKILDTIKKTKGDFQVEIDTGDEEKEIKIPWSGDDDMIGNIKIDKKEKAE